jgi:hypothetical protein
MAHRQRWISSLLSVLIGGTAIATAALPVGAASSGARVPSVRLRSALANVTAEHFKGEPVFIDPGVVLAAVGGAWQINAARPDYDHPVSAVQVIKTPAGYTYRRLPAGLVSSLKGMRGFLHVLITNRHGRRVLSHSYRFCPDGADSRVSPNGPMNPTFPRVCFAGPFALGSVWGIDRGWAVSAFGFRGIRLKAKNGRYHMTISLGREYARFFHVPHGQDSVSLGLRVKTSSQGCTEVCPCPPFCTGAANDHHRRSSRRGPLGVLPTRTNPHPGTLPDLIALPAWGVMIDHQESGDFIDFSATVWDAGPASLVVEGYRRQGKPIMDAWQYFFRNGKAVGRARVGVMRFDRAVNEQHWHFEQFARYSLLDASLHETLVSKKEGFCLAPTDAIDMTRPGAEWNPFSIGLGSACGDATSIWIRESLPTGWADTYSQTLPEQSLDITNVPNGTYYISVKANPTGKLFEVDRTNDQQLRKIVLGGTPGSRTVTVAPWHGITI